MSNSANRATPEDIQNAIQPLLEGLQDTSIDISGTSEKGDNFMGDVTFMKLSGTTPDGSSKTYDLVVKTSKKSPELRAVMAIEDVFKNEMFFYQGILPAFRKFQTDKGVKSFDNAPKCYCVSSNEETESLVLENLKVAGFDLWEKNTPMDPDHIRAVLKTYGKLHALSFALRDQKPELFRKLADKLVDIFGLMGKNQKEPEKPSIIYDEVIAAAEKHPDPRLLEKALYLKNNVKSAVRSLTDPEDPYAIILHGDCWNNNFMFKYQNDKISKVTILDYQMSRLASPVYDISYFLFCCIAPEDIGNFMKYNNVYYESLTEHLKELGSDVEKVFPFEELMRQWKRFSMFGLYLFPNIMKICLTKKSEATDLAETIESGKDLATSMQNSEWVKNEEFARRTLAILQLIVDQELL